MMKVVLPFHFATIDAVAIVTMISLKINNKKVDRGTYRLF